MNRQTFSKIAALVALGVASWFCTSKIIAQGRLLKTNAQQGQADQGLTKSNPQQGQVAPGPALTKTKGLLLEDVPNLLPLKSDAHFRFEEVTMNVTPGKVAVHAQLKMEDSRPGKAYVWALLVEDPESGDPVQRKDYDHQQFSVKPGEVFRPTFDETIALPSGSYKVKLVLYDVPPGATVASQLSPEAIITGHEKVLVP